MKYKIILGALISVISSATFAQMTLEDVNRNLDAYDRYVPPQSEMDQRWRDFNAVSDESGSGDKRKWYSQAFVQGRSYTNNYSHEIVVNARGGSRNNGNPYDNQNNRCQLSIIVDGHIVASSANSNNQFTKECFVTANVPVNSRYQITSNPWQSTGSYSTSVNVLR